MAEKCLVTGASGFNGFHMAALLREKGCEVRATDVANKDPGFWEKRGVEFIEADLTRKETLKPVVKGMEWVFHPAALFDYLAPWDLLEKVNVGGMRNMIEVCLDEGVKRFILWSTAGVYGPLKPELLPCREDHPKNPANNYERSKWAQEQLLMEYVEKHGFPASVIRPAPVYGPRNVYGIAQLITAIARGWLGMYVTNYKNRLPFVHVADVVRSALFLAPKKETAGEAYNVVDDTHYYADDIMPYIGKLTDSVMVPVWVAKPLYRSAIRFGYNVFVRRAESLRKKGRRPLFDPDTILYGVNDYWFSNEKIKGLGFELTYPDVKTGIVTAVDWLKKEGMI
ncbi:MAG: NAD(P)-dependent oxidoreductase [bacterium]